MDLAKIEKIKQLPTRGLIPGYKQDVKQFNAWLNGRTIIPENITDIIGAYFEHMLQASKKPATVRRHKASIKKSVINLMGGQNIDLNVKERIDKFFRQVKTPKSESGIVSEKMLSKQELKDIIEASGYKTGLIIRALYSTAARISELCSIKLENCQEQAGGIVITIIGKGDKERTFFMTTELYNEIRSAYTSDTWLFGNGKPLGRMTIYTLVKRAARKIGRPDISPHNLRHSWASLSLESGMSLPQVSGYLGHSSIQTTVRFYLHGKPAMADVLAVNQLNAGI